MLTGKQRAYLRSLAANMDTIFQIGKGGVSEELCEGLSRALDARELVKAKVLENSGYTAREAAEEIAAALGAQVVTTVGTKFVLYRRSERELKKRIELP
ncbi:MAG: YhbY family RNA-binding protein [Clostridia bacterium]|nr:YhbY family RNA-binding protein [Clostridia bacterium]